MKFRKIHYLILGYIATTVLGVVFKIKDDLSNTIGDVILMLSIIFIVAFFYSLVNSKKSKA